VGLTPLFLVVCALLVVSGTQKLRWPRRAVDSLRLVGVPAPAVGVRVVGVAELSIGVVAALWPTALTASLVALVYAAFIAFLALLLRPAAGAADCGCFGDVEAPAGPIHVALDAAACLVAIVAAVAPPPGLGWVLTRAPLEAVALMLGTCGAAFAAYLAFTALPGAWDVYRREARS
jgi:hypothetical protein